MNVPIPFSAINAAKVSVVTVVHLTCVPYAMKSAAVNATTSSSVVYARKHTVWIAEFQSIVTPVKRISATIANMDFIAIDVT